MDSNMVGTIRDIYTAGADMLDDVTVPGTGITFWALFTGFFMLVICIKLIGVFMGMSLGASSFGAGSGAVDSAMNLGKSVDSVARSSEYKREKSKD